MLDQDRIDASNGDEVIRHALAGADLTLAAELIAAEGRRCLARGELTMLQGWLAALPSEQAAVDPALIILRAWTLVWAYEPAGVAALLPLLVGAPPDLAAEVLALRAFVARSRDEVKAAVQFSEQALSSASDNPLLRGFIYAGLGDTAWFAEDAARAIACISPRHCSRPASRVFVSGGWRSCTGASDPGCGSCCRPW